MASLRAAAALAAVLCFAAALPRGTAAPASQISLVQTAQGTGDLLTPQPPLSWQPDAFAAPSTVTIDRTTRLQSIIGFGGAFTEAAAITLQGLRSDLAQQVIDAYFGPDGIHYTLTRVHMGR